ncbi:hypothetical protein ACWGI8_05695 [Streptomyces sp. NPDC054841]
MTIAAPQGTQLPERCHRAARQDGLAPALTVLGSSLLPGLLPYGPSGHAVVPAGIYDNAVGLWADGVTCERRAEGETKLATVDLPGGSVVMAAATGYQAAAVADEDQRASFALGLVWVRLGLSEALRADCLRYLGRRRTGDSYLLQQQMVKGTVAETVVEHLEIRAVLAEAGPGDLPFAMLRHLHAQITRADREQVRLLGASGFLTEGPGMTAYVSELLAEVHAAAEERS